MKALFRIAIALLSLSCLNAVEVLEADPLLSGRLAGAESVESSFGEDIWGTDFRLNDYLLGTINRESNVECAALFAFRITRPFIKKLRDGGVMEIMFTIPRMHEGDARKILPIDIQLLKRNASTAHEAAKSEIIKTLGSISSQELEIDQLYKYSLDKTADLKFGDIIWIGLNGRNPLEGTNHNLLLGGDLITLPGSVPPMLVAGFQRELSDTVQGMSFLTLLHSDLNAPARPQQEPAHPLEDAKWVNPFTAENEITRLQAIGRILRRELKKLPAARRQPMSQTLGFHSSIKPIGKTWTLHLPVDGVATALCLVPSLTVEGEQIRASAFPKRFSITAHLPEGAGEVVIADWTAQDFPLNNSTPVVFSFPWKTYESIEFKIHRGNENGNHHSFSLEEIYLYRPLYEKQLRTVVEIEAEDATTAEPFWSPEYLTDGRTSLGLPVMAKSESSGTPVISFHHPPLATPEITLNLPGKQSVFSIDLYPTSNSLNPELPADSFPQALVIEFSNDPEFKNIHHTIDASSSLLPIPVWGAPVNIRFDALVTRFVRLRFTKLAQSGGLPQLGLQEIRFNDGRSLARSEVSLTGFPEETTATQFIDNHANGHRIGEPLPWIIRLVRRDVVNAKLLEIKARIESLKKAKRRTSRVLVSSAAGLFTLLFGSTLFWQKRRNTAEQVKIRKRIQQDLHDEIGSNLGTVSLITSHLMRGDVPDEIREELDDLNKSAREATSSLREVIWLTDKSILTLDKAFTYIRLRAEQMVHDCKLIVDIPEAVPPVPITGIFKRNLFLLFTEIIHNSQKHANADKVEVTLHLSGMDLTMSIKDDGEGFHLDTVREGIGLQSMRDRATNLGGQLAITSSPQTGTSIILTTTLKPASKAP